MDWWYLTQYLVLGLVTIMVTTGWLIVKEDAHAIREAAALPSAFDRIPLYVLWELHDGQPCETCGIGPDPRRIVWPDPGPIRTRRVRK